MIRYIRNFFTKGHERTLLAKRNIAGTFLMKFASIFISLILVPLTINYVNPTEFGIWITISSFLTWFSFFDIGFGSGLKNKLAVAVASGNYKLAKIYVSTTYFILTIISFSILIVFSILNIFLDWSKILNAPTYLEDELKQLVLIIVFVFSFQFVLQLINIVIAAKQNAFITSVINFLGNLLSLITIFILSNTTSGSLVYLGLAISLCPVFIFTIFSIILYKGRYRDFAPSLKMVHLKYGKDLMGLGVKFFIIQIGLIFFYNVDNLIITNIVSPDAVTSYNVAFRYFSIITMIASIIMTPIWPAFTEANAKGDFIWIKSTVNKLLKFCVIILGLGLIMLFASSYLYKFWVGKKISISFALSTILFLFTVVNAYRTVFCYYLNGVGKIQVQLYEIIIVGLINIPLGMLFGKLWGVEGVIAATTILCILCAFIETIQYKKIINNKASGIWNR